jgi:RHH-type transcriptional regulator, rel operon repressor / antitoxin RelB
MAISLRLTKSLEQALTRAARSAGLSKSAYVRRCLERELAADAERPTFYEAGKHLFGRYGSGRGDLARNSEQILKEMLRAKHRRR